MQMTALTDAALIRYSMSCFFSMKVAGIITAPILWSATWRIYKDFGCKLQHVACPVPCAMVKAAECAGEMALKKNVTFTIE